MEQVRFKNDSFFFLMFIGFVLAGVAQLFQLLGGYLVQKQQDKLDHTNRLNQDKLRTVARLIENLNVHKTNRCPSPVVTIEASWIARTKPLVFGMLDDRWLH